MKIRGYLYTALMILLFVCTACRSSNEKITMEENCNVTHESLVTWSPDGKSIAFSYKALKNQGIGILNIRNKSFISIDEAMNFSFPSWSSDSSLIAFNSMPNAEIWPLQSTSIWISNKDGVRLRNITVNNKYLDNNKNHYPNWSPTDNLLAFISEMKSESRLIIYNLDNNHFRIMEPYRKMSRFAWSPDGQNIAFTSNNKLRLLSLEDGAVILLADGGNAPTWSPDGSYIAFTCFEGAVGANICLVSLETLDARLLIENGSNPIWSPDGKYIAFSRLREGFRSIWLFNIEEMKLNKITNNAYNNITFTWSPSGDQLAFESDRDGDWDIWVINVDGSGLINVTDNFCR